MAQLRGSFFTHLRAALEQHDVLWAITPHIASSSRLILDAPDPSAWYDEGHAVEIYEMAARARDLAFVRELGRDAACLAMASSWREMMQVIESLIGATPRLAFEQLPVLWHNTRRDAGELRCLESSLRHAESELRDFPHTTSDAWNEVWAGHHDALLRHLRFSGESTILAVDGAEGLIRIRTAWDAAR